MNFEKPEYKITEYDQSKNYGKFELEPLERGIFYARICCN